MKIRTFINIGIAILMLFVVVAGACYFSSKHKLAEIRDRDPIVNDDNGVNSIVWSFDIRDPVDPLVSDAPTTEVSVEIDGKEYQAGTYTGSCSEVDVEEEDLTLLSSIRCWWAGGGDDVGVFLESGEKVIKHRILEEGNAEEGSSFIGEFEVIHSV